MTRDDCIRRSCQLQALVAESLSDWQEPSDCFCNHSGPWTKEREISFRHAGLTFDFIEAAILEKMNREKINIDPVMLRMIEEEWPALSDSTREQRR